MLELFTESDARLSEAGATLRELPALLRQLDRGLYLRALALTNDLQRLRLDVADRADRADVWL